MILIIVHFQNGFWWLDWIFPSFHKSEYML